MSDLLNKLKSELVEFIHTNNENGGISDILEVDTEPQVGDPGMMLATEFPFVMVEAGRIEPVSETAGRAGYDVLNFYFNIGIFVDNTDFFDPTSSNNEGEDELVDAGTNMLLWFRRLANRRLDGLPGIRNVVVSAVDFLPSERGDVYARSAQLVLTVERQYQHKP